MTVKDKEKLNNPLKGWQILNAISSMVFHTVQWGGGGGVGVYSMMSEVLRLYRI